MWKFMQWFRTSIAIVERKRKIFSKWRKFAEFIRVFVVFLGPNESNQRERHQNDTLNKWTNFMTKWLSTTQRKHYFVFFSWQQRFDGSRRGVYWCLRLVVCVLACVHMQMHHARTHHEIPRMHCVFRRLTFLTRLFLIFVNFVLRQKHLEWCICPESRPNDPIGRKIA